MALLYVISFPNNFATTLTIKEIRKKNAVNQSISGAIPGNISDIGRFSGFFNGNNLDRIMEIEIIKDIT
jgi:hypothetical protein